MPTSQTRAGGLAARGLRLAQALRTLGLVIASAAVGAASAPAATPVAAVCPHRIVAHCGDATYVIPCSQTPTDPAQAQRAVVLIHGINRDAGAYFTQVRRLLDGRPDDGRRTLLIAPQFLQPADIAAHRLGPRFLCWDDWAWGGQSSPVAGAGAISSFDVMDALLRGLADRRALPSLRQVVVIGHSAGGQFVNRYAAAGRAEDEVLRPRGIAIDYVVAAPSSYLYFTRERRVPGRENSFAPVEPGLSASLEPSSYDDYGYGLEHLERYPYLAAVGAETIARQYPLRRVTYLIGGQDDDPDSPYLARSYPAMLQGEDRLERGMVYRSYLRHTFGPDIEQRHTLVVVPGAGHQSGPLFGSPEGLALLTGDG